MKVVVLIFYTIILISSLQGQSFSENDSLYIKALEQYLVQIDSFYNQNSSKPSKYDKVYIQKTNLVEGLPESLGTKKIIVLTTENQEGIYRQNNRNIIHVKITPMKIVNGEIHITIIPYLGRLQTKRKYFLELSSWTTTSFKQDCETGKWYYRKTKNGGI